MRNEMPVSKGNSQLIAEIGQQISPESASLFVARAVRAERKKAA